MSELPAEPALNFYLGMDEDETHLVGHGLIRWG